MSRLDIIIFGATGFTGKHAVKEMVLMMKKEPGLTWGVAGRNRKKLDDLLIDVAKDTGEDLTGVQKFTADIKNEVSLKDMCSNAKVVVNCCGPYRFYGEPVVRAALESKTHYIDISGEPQFMETMQLNYDTQAREAGVYVVSACGFDSIPADLGVVFLQKHFEGTLNSVEGYLQAETPPGSWKDLVLHGVLHYGTWQSAVYGLSHNHELPELRKKLYPERLPTFQPKLKPRCVLHRHEGSWCVPFPGSDRSVVYRTQRRLHDAEHRRPAQFKPYVRLSLLATLAAAAVALLMFVLTRTRLTRKLLLLFPRLCSLGLVSRDGPTEAVMEGTRFQFYFYGCGWPAGADVNSTPPTKKMVAKVSGTNPGYGATVVAALQSAATVLREAAAMPSTGGVLTTGAAFQNTTLIERLHEKNLKFELINSK